MYSLLYLDRERKKIIVEGNLKYKETVLIPYSRPLSLIFGE